jgi:hypothetical protein
VRTKTPRQFFGSVIAATHNISQFYSLAQLQIALPPHWNAIILDCKVGIGPVVPDSSIM